MAPDTQFLDLDLPIWPHDPKWKTNIKEKIGGHFIYFKYPLLKILEAFLLCD